MSARNHARYDELLDSLYLGRMPPWVPSEACSQLRLLSDRRRLAITRRLGVHFPNGAYYASACAGIRFLDGVCAALVDLPGEADEFLGRIDAAVGVWLTQLGSLAMQQVFAYDDMLRTRPRCVVASHIALGKRLGLAPGFSCAEFDHDVLGFVTLLEDLRFHFAPAEIVCTYEPMPRRQILLVCDDDAKALVRDVTPFLDDPD